MTAPPPPLGYLVPEFPTQTHAFFWREAAALRRFGTSVHILSTRSPPADACRHSWAADARGQTRYLFPPGVGAVGWLLARPLATLAAVRYVLGLRESDPRAKLRLLGLLPSAAELVRYARRHGLWHVHVHSCGDAAHLAALARVLGGPGYSLTLHGDLPVYGKDHPSKMARAETVVTVTRPLREQVLGIGVPADKVEVIWMGVDLAAAPPSPERTGEAGRLHAVTVARLNLAKGHRFALAAVRAAVDAGRDVRYSIAGEGPARAAIEADVDRLGLADRVALLGTLGEEAVRDLLARADAFVLPSVGLGEAAPVAVMEAMAAGLPVVSTVIGGVPDMVADGEDGLLVPQADVPALTAALLRVADDVPLRGRLGRAARARAERQFDSSALARRLLGVIARPAPAGALR